MSEDLVLDFSQIDEAEPISYEPLDRGKYPCEVDESTFSYSQNGNAMITVRYEVTEGQYAGRKLWDRLVLSEKAGPFLKAKLRVLLDEKAFAKLRKIDAEWMESLAESGKLIGCEVIADVRVDRRNDRNEINAIYSPEEVAVESEEFV